MEKQIQLFDVSLPEEKLRNKRREPLFRVEIISEKDGEIFVFWERAWKKLRAKKLATIEYNDIRSYDQETPVKFGKVKEVKKTKRKKKEGIIMKNEKSEGEKRARKCGYYFKPNAEIQRKAIIKNLNKRRSIRNI